MTIEHFFNRSFVIRRLQTVSGYRRQHIATGTVDGHIQRLDESTSSPSYAVYGATHKLWVALEHDVKDGDRAFDSDGNAYDVVAVINEGYGVAMNEHKEVLLRLYLPQTNPRE